MKYFTTYRAVDDFLPLAQANFPAHRARLDLFAARSVLLLAGPLGEPSNGDSISVFTSSCSTVSSPSGRCGPGTRCCSPGS